LKDAREDLESRTTARDRLVYTPAGAAELLGVHKSTVYRRIKEGAIPIVKMGRGRVFIPKKPFEEIFGTDA
jgi:excisionase family DNA binding protein